MSILIKIVVGIGIVFMVISSICVTIAAIFPPKEYKGDGKTDKPRDWDESIEDV